MSYEDGYASNETRSSEPSERAWQWASEEYGGNAPSYYEEARAFDAGYSEGEKKGAAVGYLAALREAKGEGERIAVLQRELVGGSMANACRAIASWLDRRLREAEENAK